MSRELKILKDYLLYFLVFILVCFYGITHPKAYTYETVGMVTDKTQIQVEVNYTPQPLSVAVGQHVQLSGLYSIDIFISNIDYSPDYVYQFELYTPNVILTGANAATVVDQSGATQKSCRVLSTQFTNEYPQLTFKCDSNTNITNLYIRYYNSSNGYLFEGSKNWYWTYAHFRRRTADTNDNTGEITDAIGQNTQDIINNNNQNTQQIIDNQNINTDKEIESQKVCSTKIIDKTSIIYPSSYLISSTGGIGESTDSNGVTDYFSLDNAKIKVLTKRNSAYFCYYDENKNFINCSRNNTLVVGDYLVFPSNSKYVRFTINFDENMPSFSYEFCGNGNQALNDSIEEQNKTSKGILGKLGDLITGLFDTSGPDTDDLDDVAGWLPAGPVDSIITLPLTLINSILSGLGATCSPLQVPIPFVSQSFELPCINTLFSQISGVSTLYTWFGPIASAFLLYYYFKSLYKWINEKLSFKDDNEWGGV